MATPDPRTALIERITKETSVQVSLSLDGGPLEHLPARTAFDNPPASSAAALSAAAPRPIPAQTEHHHASQESARQQIWIWTGIGFLDHMLHALAKHGGWSLRVRTRGDLVIDDHHTAEDTFLALGAALDAALGARTGIARYGYAYAPLDEALARAVVDVSSRPFFVGTFDFKDSKIGDLATQMIPHCLQSFAQASRLTMHVDVLRGDNDHHRAEAAFKALAVALRMALARPLEKVGEVVSTKGVL